LILKRPANRRVILPPGAGNVRLLWVENHTVFVRIAGKQLLAGHDLSIVSTIAHARELLAHHTFDAVLLDYDLDDGKGTELIPFIRQLATIPVVIATSSHDDGNNALNAAGADGICPKGKFSQIATILESCIAHQKF